jgi:predicted lipoprotein with Yx(FWY)xxD motif
MSRHSLARALAVLPLLAGPAFAQDQAETIMTAESPDYGAYLADGESRSVYMFEADTQGQGDTAAVSACMDECLAEWPPVTTTGEPQAGEGAMAEMLGTLTRDDGSMQVTYNGWPLYYYHEDEAAGDTKGHDIEEFGGEWYLVTAEGEEVGEGEEESGEEADEASGDAASEEDSSDEAASGENGGSDY